MALRQVLKQQKWLPADIEELMQYLATDFKKGPLSKQDLIMLEYVEKLTLQPGCITNDDVQSLKTAGFVNALFTISVPSPPIVILLTASLTGWAWTWKNDLLNPINKWRFKSLSADRGVTS